MTLHENGSLHGQWPRIWARAGGEPSDAEEHLPLFQYIILFRRQQPLTAESAVQIHSFSEDQGKCNQTGNPSISDFSANLTSDILILADSSHLPSDEALSIWKVALYDIIYDIM